MTPAERVEECVERWVATMLKGQFTEPILCIFMGKGFLTHGITAWRGWRRKMTKLGFMEFDGRGRRWSVSLTPKGREEWLPVICVKQRLKRNPTGFP